MKNCSTWETSKQMEVQVNYKMNFLINSFQKNQIKNIIEPIELIMQLKKLRLED